MADPKKLRDDLLKGQGRAIVQAGKDAARRVYEDLTLSDEEKAVKEAERARAAKLRRWKWIAIGIGALLALITLFVLVMKLWVWMLALVVLAALAFALYFYGRGKLRALRDPEPALPEAQARENDTNDVVVTPSRTTPGRKPAVHATPNSAAHDADAHARAADVAAREARAADAAAREKAIDDELAALKAKTRK